MWVLRRKPNCTFKCVTLYKKMLRRCTALSWMHISISILLFSLTEKIDLASKNRRSQCILQEIHSNSKAIAALDGSRHFRKLIDFLSFSIPLPGGIVITEKSQSLSYHSGLSFRVILFLLPFFFPPDDFFHLPAGSSCRPYVDPHEIAPQTIGSLPATLDWFGPREIGRKT